MLYEYNGLHFWSEQEISVRNMIVDFIKNHLQLNLVKINQAFKFIQCEAPVLTPIEFINKSYTNEDYYQVNEKLVLRPETTMGSYIYAKNLIKNNKVKLPIVVWQHGKSFRKEQDQPFSKIKLKEFNQLEFQIIYSNATKDDYYSKIIPIVLESINLIIGNASLEKSDRLPEYSTETNDIMIKNMEVCSISRRKDFSEEILVSEIAFGTDRLTYQFLTKNN